MKLFRLILKVQFTYEAANLIKESYQILNEELITINIFFQICKEKKISTFGLKKSNKILRYWEK